VQHLVVNPFPERTMFVSAPAERKMEQAPAPAPREGGGRATAAREVCEAGGASFSWGCLE
jgi:hypothetical protein